MKILFVPNCCPWPPETGMHQRVFHLLAALTRHHRVTVVMPAAPAGTVRPPLADECERVVEVPPEAGAIERRRRFSLWAPARDRVATLLSSPLPNNVREQWNPPLLDALRALRAEGQGFESVWAERAYCAEMCRQAGFRDIVVDLYDIEAISLQRTLAHSPWYASKPLHYAELAKTWLYERAIPRRFGRVTVCKEEDRQFFPGGGKHVFVVANGIPDLACSDAAVEQPGEMVFVGTMHYSPNVDAARWFHGAMLPLVAREIGEARFRIVGKTPVPSVFSLGNERCTVHPDVADVAPYFDRSSVVVAPIRLGSGTRLKVLEALARGKALVATSTAVEGLDLRPGVDFEMADEADAFAAACVRLLRSPEARRRLGESGRRRVLEHYTWEAIGETANRVIAIESWSPLSAS